MTIDIKRPLLNLYIMTGKLINGTYFKLFFKNYKFDF